MKEQSATRDGKELNLSSRELKLLIFFMKNREQALSRIAIAQAVWNIDFDTTSNTVDVYINYFQNKIMPLSSHDLQDYQNKDLSCDF